MRFAVLAGFVLLAASLPAAPVLALQTCVTPSADVQCPGVAASLAGQATASQACVSEAVGPAPDVSVCSAGVSVSGAGDARAQGACAPTPGADPSSPLNQCLGGVALSLSGDASGDYAVSPGGHAHGRAFSASACDEASVACTGPAAGFAASVGLMADDGFLLLITQESARAYDLRVLGQEQLTRVAGEAVGAQYDFVPVDVAGPQTAACASAADPACDGAGVFLATARAGTAASTDACPATVLPYDTCYAPQTVELRYDAAAQVHYLHVELTGPAFNPTFQGAALGSVDAVVDDHVQKVSGFYNPLKLSLPLDALDAAPYPVRIS